MTLPVRSLAATGSRRPVARASAGLSLARALAAGGVLASAAALYGLSSSEAFELRSLEITGAGYTAESAVRSTVRGAVGDSPNLFRVRSEELAAELGELPPVLATEVRVALPDRLLIRIIERQPVLVWEAGSERFLVDAEGVLFAAAPAEPTETAEHSATDGLPLARDRRRNGADRSVGQRLDPLDLAVVRQLGAVTPASLGSSSTGLAIEVDDREGWTLDAQPRGWHAIFGFYVSRLRTADLVPRQVQCLGALLAQEEIGIGTVFLTPSRDRCGTYEARPGS